MALYIKIITALFLVLFALFSIMLFRAEIYFPFRNTENFCNQTHNPIAGKAIVDRFRQALQIKTISQTIGDYDTEALVEFAQFLQRSFPTIYSSSLVTVEKVNKYSLLYTIKGEDPSLKPYLLCSHIDVVPVELDKWTYPPFEGVVSDDNYIYGRGSIDVKNTLMAIMESLEYLLKNNFKPKRSFYIAFGHDEEIQGFDGAQEIAKVFKSKRITEFEYLLDEGMLILKDRFPGVNSLVAVVAVTEKGYLTLKIKANGSVGHSSLAPVDTAITTLARAVSKLTGTSHQNLFGLGPERDMIQSFASYATYPYKLIYSNLWFFSPILSKVFSNSPTSNSLVRTTSAVTIINGGFKDNVLPSSAEAVVNHRIHPMQTVEEVINYDKFLINDPNVKIEIKGSYIQPHPISPYHSEAFGFQTIKRSIQQVFENTIAIPGLMVASTDTRWYLNFTKSVYRFSPSIMLSENDTKRIHGHDERISVDNYIKIVNFYHHIMLNSNKKELDSEHIIKDEL